MTDTLMTLANGGHHGGGAWWIVPLVMWSVLIGVLVWIGLGLRRRS